jgi:O-antigen/teichoic acid export membrane protein
MNVLINIWSKVNFFFTKGSERSLVIKKNIVQSFVFKVASILLSLLIVPLTINYVSAEQYGIWLTISSIVAWIGYFDLGLGNGLRNKYAEAKAIGNYQLSSKYISTTYAIFALLFLAIFIIFFIANQYIDWCNFLNVEIVDNFTFKRLMIILVGFFCLTMFFNVLNSLLLGDQRTALASGISVAGQALSLIFIFVLSKTAESSLIYLAFIFSGVPCLILLLVSICVFASKSRSIYGLYRPSLSNIDFKLTGKLIGLGGKFFMIQVSLLMIFQCVNIILSRNCGQIAVTQYNIVYKYFQMIYMANVIILTPFWSAFTDAYTKNDFTWMQSAFKKLNRIVLLCIPAFLLMLLISQWFFKFWIGDSVTIPFSLSLCMGLYTIAMTYASLHMYILNGIGKVSIQLIVYITFALIVIPTMDVLSKQIGMYGILILLTLVYITQALIGRIQINRILSRKAIGIWNR